MPCYNSLAADRHADEEGRLEEIELALEKERREALDTFMYGDEIEGLDAEDLLADIWSDVELYKLIEHAWRSGEYRQLGSNIEELIREHAKDRIDKIEYH